MLPKGHLQTLWQSGLRAGGSASARPQRLGMPGQATASARRARSSPPSKPQLRPHPPCPRWPLGPLLRPPDGPLVPGPRGSAPRVSLPGARWSQPRRREGGGPGGKAQAPGLSFNSSPGKWGQCPCCEGFQRTTTTKHPTHTHCARAGARAGAPGSQASGWAAPATSADSCSPAGRLCGSPEASTADPNVTPHVAGSQMPSLGEADTKATKPALTGANTSSS